MPKIHDMEMICVRPCDIQAHLGLGLQPDNLAHTVPKPKPQAALKSIRQKISINSYHTTPLGSHPVNCFPNKEAIARLFSLSVAWQYLRSIAAKYIR